MFRPTQFFCDSTSIHGLKYTRLAASYIEWLLPLGVAYYILIYELNGTITKFTGFHQKLTVKYPDSSEYGGQEFPAITICPKTVFRKSRVGGVGVALMMTGTNADWGSVDEAVSLDKHAVCDGDHTLESYHGSRTVVLSFTIEGMKRGWGALGQLYLADSRSSTNQCKFQGKNISCSNLFYNTWTDNGWCFTFNLDSKIIESNLVDDFTEMGYGSVGYSLKKQLIVGRKSGLEIILNADVDDYCYPFFPYGSGFTALIHDPKSLPLIKYQRQVDFSPGFATNVEIKKKQKVMTTESYGYCSSWHNYTLYEPGLYKKGDCLKECLTLEVWHQCGCLPFYSPPLTYTKMMKPPFRTEDVSDYMFSNSLKRLKRYQWCSPTNGPCVKPVEKNGVGAEGTCSKRCPQPCQETKFSFLSSQSRFPTPEIMSKIRRTFNFTSNYSLKKARLNLISANFYFGSTVNTVEQIDIAMTWVDLLSQLGGALGLCIGASLLSLVEILAWLFWQFALLVRTLFRAAYCPEFAYEQKKYI